jgi:GrpB-like predicted nucleotidyltransferase (UPF0157 family)
MKLGLPNDTVEIVPYTSQWVEAFEAEKKRILARIADYSPVVEHIGSTSVEGISSKPIIDIAVGIPSYDVVEEVIRKLAEIGYSSRGYRSEGLGRILELKQGDRRTHCVHLLDMSKSHWDDCLFFRDTLRGDEALKKEYQQYKLELSQKFKKDRQKYTQEKNVFVERVLRMRCL